MRTEDDLGLRDQFDSQVRRNATPDGSGSTVHVTPDLVRWAANDGLGWSEISWARLNAESAHDVIARQIDFFHELGQRFVWRVYDYDEPSDLGARLLDAGFTLLSISSVMITDTASLVGPEHLPNGAEMVEVTNEAGVDLLIRTHEAVFGHSHQDLRRSILARLKTAPLESAMFVVTAKGAPVSAARIEFRPNCDLATLWGGGTMPEWRGQGIYKALLYRRAQVALNRGYRRLVVLASEQSQSILQRLGFRAIAGVTTYSWDPPTSLK
ncbi:MAG TPA: GNAT family N-acetyltransferase [Acidimicrobiales bacterium]|nr:GNAT family N-acetyltransferase [Acidimicrobiales bacterium]